MGDPFGWVAEQLMLLLTGWGLSAGLAEALLKAVGAAVLGTGCLLATFLLIWAERKILARFQDRIGPNRAGPFGVVQTVADFLKLVTKEIIIPDGVDRIAYFLAPPLVVMSVVGIWGVVPFAPRLFGTDINVGVLYIVSVGAVGTLGILMAGWSSNNKFAVLGAFRAVAQLVSYEVPMVLTLLIPTMLAGSMGLVQIVEQQRGMWFVVLAPVAALVFLISSIAENGRAPFDLMEGESEIVAGFNVEYSALAFGMFFVAEFLHAFTVGAVFATVFLGGWEGPGAESYPLLGLVYFFLKTALIWFITIWIRGSFPRVRIDQMLALNWKFLTPLALGVVIVTAVADKAATLLGWSRLGVLAAVNAVMVAVTMWALRGYARAVREREEKRLVRGATATAH